MPECGDRTAVAIDRQAVDRRAFQQKRHDLGFMENARDQLAVFQVVGGEGGFILGKAAIDLIHTIPGVINGFSFAEQFLRDGFQRKRRKIPERGFKRVDTIDNDSPSGLGEKNAVFEAMFAPLQFAIVSPQP